MKVFSFLVLSLGLIFFASSCDVIDTPLAKSVVDTNKTDTTKKRKVLLEDYTGFTCGHCPKAARLAKSLKDLYGEKLVIMAVHSGFFAKPNSKHTYDFRTPEGNELDTYFENSLKGNPNGLVGRVDRYGSRVLMRDVWASVVDSLSKLPCEAYITLGTQYDTTSRLLFVTADMEYFKNGSADHYISLFVIENDFVQYQLDYEATPSDVDNYIHEHVLRASFNGTWGDQISATAPKAGNTFRKTYSMTLKPEWNAKKCAVVAFIHNNKTKEVIQAEDKSLF